MAGRHSRTRAIGPVAAHRLLVTEEEQAILNVVREVQSLTRPDERLYVGTVRHDQLVIADTLFGFLANRRPATYYHELHPGLTTTRTVQERILRALATEDVRCIVLVDLEANAVNEGPGGQGVTHLDDTIRSRFLSIGSAYPPYQLWWRKDAGIAGEFDVQSAVEQLALRVRAALAGPGCIGRKLDSAEQTDAANIRHHRNVPQRVELFEKVRRQCPGTLEQILTLEDVHGGNGRGAGSRVPGVGVAMKELDRIRCGGIDDGVIDVIRHRHRIPERSSNRCPGTNRA